MDVVTIEAKTFEAMLSTLENFAERMEQFFHLHGEKDLSKWLDNQDVCQLINVSPRTLQTLRTNGTLAYSKIGNKIYYKLEDVQKILSVVEEKREKAERKGKSI